MLHRNVTPGGNHMAHNWEYADAAARLSATGFLGTDVNKLALQLDNNSFWILTDDSPVTWVDPSAAALAAKTLDSLTIHGADKASAGTLNLDTATGDLVDVTGTTTITAITLTEGRWRTVRFTGILALTHGSSLVLPTAADITTAVGDYAIFRGYAAGVVRCVGYFRANGTALASDPLKAAKAANLSDLADAAEARVNLNVSTVAVAADEIDWALGEKFSKTLSANWSPTFANDDDGMTIIVRLTSGGAYTVTWPTVLWAGGVPPDQTPSGDDVYTFVKMGSDIIGSVVQDLA